MGTGSQTSAYTVKPKLLFQQTIWLLQLHNCLPLLIQGMQWTSGCKN